MTKVFSGTKVVDDRTVRYSSIDAFFQVSSIVSHKKVSETLFSVQNGWYSREDTECRRHDIFSIHRTFLVADSYEVRPWSWAILVSSKISYKGCNRSLRQCNPISTAWLSTDRSPTLKSCAAFSQTDLPKRGINFALKICGAVDRFIGGFIQYVLNTWPCDPSQAFDRSRPDLWVR